MAYAPTDDLSRGVLNLVRLRHDIRWSCPVSVDNERLPDEAFGCNKGVYASPAYHRRPCAAYGVLVARCVGLTVAAGVLVGPC